MKKQLAIETSFIPLEKLLTKISYIDQSPKDKGIVKLIVQRPDTDLRIEIKKGTFKPKIGLIGDNYHVKPCAVTKDKSPHPKREIALINSRVMEAVSPDSSRRKLAGDQLHVDFDLTKENVPPGTLLKIGTTVLEVSDCPHPPCHKFSSRYGKDALRFTMKKHNGTLFRGIFATIKKEGFINEGDTIKKVNNKPYYLFAALAMSLILSLLFLINLNLHKTKDEL